MKYEKIDNLIFLSVNKQTSVYDIMLSIFNITHELIAYEDLDMGLNRLITNKLVKKDKNLYSLSKKGNLILEKYDHQMIKENKQEVYQNVFNDMEMDKVPNLLRCFLPNKVYMSALKKLASELGEDKLQMNIFEPFKNKSKGKSPFKSKEIIIKMLAEANITINHFSLNKLCQVLRKFMNIEFNAEDDDLLFQTGVFFDKEIFTFDFTRQFSFNNRYGGYSHLTQLSITFEFENSPELTNLSTAMWSMDFNALDEFFSAVQLTESYLKIKNKGNPKNISIIYERV